MKILAPVNTYESAVKGIESGADEIYLGADEGLFQSYSFTGRGKLSHENIKVLSSFEEVDKIVKYAHSQNVSVNFLCNTQFLTDNRSDNIEKAVLAYIDEAISIGVDSIVVGDIGLLYLLNKKNIKTPIHASLYFRTVNVAQLAFLRGLGVVRTTLPYLLSLDEIKIFTEAKIMEIEVPGYLGCSFYNGACNCLHSLGEEDSCDCGIMCKSKYEVYDNTSIECKSFFDNEMGCSLCFLKSLESINVAALKIVGRDRNYNVTSEVISIYKNSLTKDFNPDSLSSSWKFIWCRNNRCKFNNPERIKYFV